MNIDDYRAMVAEEAKQTDSPKGEQLDAQAEHQPTQVTEEVLQTEGQVADKVQEQQTTPEAQAEQSETTPEFVEVDGEKVSIEELKNGFMRQSDYTRKTQELARSKDQVEIANQYYNAINNDPELAQELASKHNLPYVSPEDARVRDLEARYNDLLLQQEITNLKNKYDDVDVQTVVKTAYEKNIVNLEDAYLLNKAANQKGIPEAEPVDADALKEQIRQELLDELKSDIDTSSVINSGGVATPVVDSEPQLTAAQARVAKGMGLSPKEYAKWAKK